MPLENYSPSERSLWLFSRRADFWLACGGAPVGLVAAIGLIYLRGDRELDWLDFVLSEFHLGATYGAIVRQRLWRDRQGDVLLVPLAILALTYTLSLSGQTILLTSIAMYAAVWHRGRQSLGIARFYQRGSGGALSRIHSVLFRGAIYLPMLAAILAYAHLAPTEYEGEPYIALGLGADISWLIGIAAIVWVVAYLIWTSGQGDGEVSTAVNRTASAAVHPGERWTVLAHAVAFGSAYVLGAANASFVLVLAVFHEVQYLYFTYAMARRSERLPADQITGIKLTGAGSGSDAVISSDSELRTELKHAADYLRWPVIGFVGAVIGGWSQISWLAPLGLGGLFCHYWLDGRIWTRRSLSV